MKNSYAKFESLSDERQDALVKAGVEVFGRSDYKSASTDAIARKAGISKGLLFFYFKNKKEFYLYVMKRLVSAVSDLVVDNAFYEIDDFFELMEYSASKKREVFQKMPFLLDFSIRVFYPEHREIKDEVNLWSQSQIDIMFNTYFKNVRFDKFRDEVKPRRVMDMLIWMADGYLHQQQCLQKQINFNELLDELSDWCAMLKVYAYKEQYQ